MKFGRFSRKSGSLEFDVNIVPIIDCLVILLTFMLASGAFVSLGALQVEITGRGDETVLSPHPQVELKVELHPYKTLVLETRKEEKNDSNKRVEFKALNRSWNFPALEEQLSLARERFPGVKSVTLVAASEISYQDLVQVMDVTRRTHPGVLIGGF